MEDVLEGRDAVLPTAQAVSLVGKVVKSAVRQGGEDILDGLEGLGRVSEDLGREGL
jgi:hypothetical protein